MSLTLVQEASLRDFRGPMTNQIVMGQVEKLNAILEAGSGLVSGSFLDKISGNIDGYCEQSRPKTADGYDWFWAQKFACGIGQVCILFPWAQDFESKDESKLDRSVAVYYRGDVSVLEVKILLSQFVTEMSKFVLIKK